MVTPHDRPADKETGKTRGMPRDHANSALEKGVRSMTNAVMARIAVREAAIKAEPAAEVAARDKAGRSVWSDPGKTIRSTIRGANR